MIQALAHYGVKGMKWGVRRSQDELDSASGRVASDDAKAADATQEKIDRGGTQALSNKELQSLIKRKNLEKQYSDLMRGNGKNSLDRGNEEIKKLLGYGKTYNEVMTFLESPLGQKLKKGFRIAGMAAKVGAAAYTGGAASAAAAGAGIAVRRYSNHYTNVG